MRQIEHRNIHVSAGECFLCPAVCDLGYARICPKRFCIQNLDTCSVDINHRFFVITQIKFLGDVFKRVNAMCKE
jgi:hypothetical protein